MLFRSFDVMNSPFDSKSLYKNISNTLELVKAEQAWPTWCLSNHDCERVASRIGADAARAMALFVLALPGSTYIYNGQELGLPSGEMEDSDRQDPIYFRTKGKEKGRDGARVPMPWSGDEAPFGFTSGKPWLPLQESWREFTVENELKDPDSSLNLYRKALALRKELITGSGEIEWLNTSGLLIYRRGQITVMLNTTESTFPIEGEVLLASKKVDKELPPRSSVWLANN